MTIVYVGENESVESAVKRFRKKCEREGIKRELKKRAFFEKPSLKRKRKIEAAKRKEQKRLNKMRRRSER